jgi:ABC-type phosphate/phosphonate transport system substrate-binding protein
MKFLSYMSPTIPEEFFLCLGRLLEQHGAFRVEVEFESCSSGPTSDQLAGGTDPFSAGRADVGVICAPTYIRGHRFGAVELLGYTPIFQEPRNGGRAVYFSDLVVAENSSVKSFQHLRGGSWAYNDKESLSGYFSMLEFLRRQGLDTGFFQRAVCSGGHKDSLVLLSKGAIDCAAIDSNLLFFLDRSGQMPRVRRIAEIGPFPAPPLVMACSLQEQRKAAIKAAFESLAGCETSLNELREKFLFDSLVETDHDHYDCIRELLD